MTSSAPVPVPRPDTPTAAERVAITARAWRRNLDNYQGDPDALGGGLIVPGEELRVLLDAVDAAAQEAAPSDAAPSDAAARVRVWLDARKALGGDEIISSVSGADEPRTLTMTDLDALTQAGPAPADAIWSCRSRHLTPHCGPAHLIHADDGLGCGWYAPVAPASDTDEALRALAEAWREEADVRDAFRSMSATVGAAALRSCADELDAALAARPQQEAGDGEAAEAIQRMHAEAMARAASGNLRYETAALWELMQRFPAARPAEEEK